jgi:RNA polymerase sigma-70 factor (ECF subfamily)
MTLNFFCQKDRFQHIRKELLGYAVTLTRDPDLADDLVQDTLLKLHGGSEAVLGARDTRNYAFRMLRNLYFDILRKNKARVAYSVEQERLWSETSTDSFDTLDQLIVRDAFSRLKPDHREILFLVDIMGFKYTEAAETLGVASGTIMSRVSRARTEMIKIIDISSVASLSE